jgi:hypothetical protein
MLVNFKQAAAGIWLVAATALGGCSNQQPAEDENTSHSHKEAGQAKAIAAYVCPMGCEGSESNKAGKCPVCEMELVRNPAYKPAAPSDSL